MSKIDAGITGIFGWVPEYRLTNDELSTMVETTDEWIGTDDGDGTGGSGHHPLHPRPGGPTAKVGRLHWRQY